MNPNWCLERLVDWKYSLFENKRAYAAFCNINPHLWLDVLGELAGFAAWGILILDLLIFCKLTPGFVIIHGTEREDYSNMKYHLVSGAKGLLRSGSIHKNRTSVLS